MRTDELEAVLVSVLATAAAGDLDRACDLLRVVHAAGLDQAAAIAFVGVLHQALLSGGARPGMTFRVEEPEVPVDDDLALSGFAMAVLNGDREGRELLWLSLSPAERGRLVWATMTCAARVIAYGVRVEIVDS